MPDAAPAPALAEDRSDINLLRFFLGMSVLSILFFCIIWLLKYFQWAPISRKSYLIASLAYIGMLMKLAMASVVSQEFRFYKHGFDLCLITLGGLFTALSAQLFSDTDMYPAFSKINWLQEILDQLKVFQDASAANKRLAMISGFIILCFLFSILITLIALDIPKLDKSIDKLRERKGKATWLQLRRLVEELFSYLLGLVALGLYVNLLVSKD